MDVIYLNFRKAFDKVPHKRLLVKVKAHGIGGKIWGWIDDWLSGRKQRVILRQDFVDLYRWSNDWLMLFNTDKCKVMNLGNQNPCVKYELGSRELESILEVQSILRSVCSA